MADGRPIGYAKFCKLEDGPVVTASQLIEHVERFAGYLREQVRPGDCVSIMLTNRAEFMVAWLAVVAALCGLAFYLLPGAYAVPTNVVPGVALFVPFARLAGAPLALEWNRHR